MNAQLIAEDVAVCRALHRKHGTSYYWATQFFPSELRTATHVLYAFFRVPDEIVDAPGVGDPSAALTAWITEWRAVVNGATTEQPVLRAAVRVFTTYDIPFSLGEAFLQAMKTDLTVSRYETYADLERYMYGSAAVVGEIMTHLFGVHDAETLAHARALGEAMQLTNFLRDVAEDYRERQRIYIPQEDLRQFGVTEDDIRQRVMSDRMFQCIAFEVARARKLYAFADRGIAQLPRSARFAVRIASRLYAEIATQLEQRHYNVFAGRVRVSSVHKLFLILSVCKNSVGR